MGDNERWFSDMLEVLVQLFAPNVVLDSGDEIIAFLRTLRNAIDRNISSAESRR
ncbi:MAG: hypothetical protein HQ582_07560 [Planctomycetes bacterium]|nr:hypothetical protein [Planctomycetota bacterium]